MRKTKSETWVVYRITLTKKHLETNALCTQCEWDAMELVIAPGVHLTLLHAGIKSEAEAEKLGRGTMGDRVRRAARQEPSELLENNVEPSGLMSVLAAKRRET